MHVAAANIPPFYLRPEFVRLSAVVTEAESSDEVFYNWLLGGSRLITVSGPSPARSAVATSLLLQIITRRYMQPVDAGLFGYINAASAFDELYTQRFTDQSALKRSLSQPGALVLDNVHSIDERGIPAFSRCVQERCNATKVTFITTSVIGYNTLLGIEDVYDCMKFGRVVKV